MPRGCWEQGPVPAGAAHVFAAVAVVVGVVSIIVAFWQEGAWGTRKRRGSGPEESRCPVPPACHFPSRPLDRRAGGWITRTAENSGEQPVTRGMQASVLHWRGGAAGSGGARLPRGEKQSGTPQDEPTDICASVSLPENEMMTAAPTLQGDGRVCLFAVPGRVLAHQLGSLSPARLEGQGRDGQQLRPPAAPLALPRRAAQPGGWGWGADAQLLRGISLVPGSQLSLLDRRAALWSGKNPLRFLKQSSRHNHLIVRVFTLLGWAAPSPTHLRPGSGRGWLCLSGKPGPCRQPQLVDDTLQTDTPDDFRGCSFHSFQPQIDLASPGSSVLPSNLYESESGLAFLLPEVPSGPQCPPDGVQTL